jgi:hypothetical protein
MSDWQLWAMTKPMEIRSVVELFDFETQRKITEAVPPVAEQLAIEKYETTVLYRARWKDSFWYTPLRDEAYETARQSGEQEPVIIGRLLKKPLPGTIPMYRVHEKGSPLKLLLGTDLEQLSNELNALYRPLLGVMGYILPANCSEPGTIPLHHFTAGGNSKDYNWFTVDEREIAQRRNLGWNHVGVVCHMFL